MKVILVPVADRPECAKALNTAFDLGKRVGASVSGCHIRPHRDSKVSLASAFADAEWRKKSNKKSSSAAKTLYRNAAEHNGYDMIRRPRQEPGALYREAVGSPDVLMGIVGPSSDLVVVSRPTKGGGVAEIFMNAAVMESTVPTLIVPQRGARNIGKRIMIGWNQSPEASRTLRASIALLVAAQEVTLVTCGPEDHPGPKASEMKRYLAHWGVKAEMLATRGRHIEQELMDAYKELGADMLVAGSYSRSRWREKVFGGTTDYLLHKASVPVLTMHS